MEGDPTEMEFILIHLNTNGYQYSKILGKSFKKVTFLAHPLSKSDVFQLCTPASCCKLIYLQPCVDKLRQSGRETMWTVFLHFIKVI